MTHKGSCLCGAFSFEVAGDLHPLDGCHCSSCRKHSGHFFASTDVPRASLAVSGEENVSSCRSSEKARLRQNVRIEPVLGPARKGLDRDRDGAFEAPAGTHMDKHIFVDGKGDYFEIADELPQHPDRRTWRRPIASGPASGSER